MNNNSRIRTLPNPQHRLRALAERAPQAEAMVASWMECARPLSMRVYALRRRIATTAVIMLAALLFVHVMLGANGMVIYKQKRTEYESLRKKIAEEQTENELYERQIQGLKTDEKAIEKEAREQLHYARPGEYVYVPPVPTTSTPPANHSAKR
jgi:cell division protein FtsB